MLDRGLLGMLKGLCWKVECDEKFTDYEHLKPAQEESYRQVKNLKWVSAVTKDVYSRVKAVYS